MSSNPERIAEEKDLSLYVITDEFLDSIALAPAGMPDTYGATPLNHAAAYEQQLSLRMQLQELLETEIPADVPHEVIEYMKDTFMSRFVSRGTANQENYLTSLKSRDQLGDDVLLQDLVTRAELGHATPAELLVVRQLLGIRSVELACLTHPYGKKIKLLNPMREAVQKNVELLGGVYDDEPEERYRVKGFVGEQHDYTKGLLMTRKRTVGIMPDGTIIRERSSFVLRLDDESVISKATIKAIENAVMKLDRKSTAWQDEAVLVGELDVIAEALLGNDAFTLAIPVSTTIYAFNSETAELVKERADEALEQRRRDSEIRYPSLLEALMAEREQRGLLSHRHVKDVNGMLYVGLEGEEHHSDD